MPISENARAVLERRYLIRDEHGEAVETVDELFHRVADAIAALIPWPTWPTPPKAFTA